MYIPLSFPMPVIIQIYKYKYIFPCIIHYAKSQVHTLLVFVIMWLYFETVISLSLSLSFSLHHMVFSCVHWQSSYVDTDNRQLSMSHIHIMFVVFPSVCTMSSIDQIRKEFRRLLCPPLPVVFELCFC